MRLYRVLTVCTGNVCRSPAAAVMLREAVRELGWSERIEVGSAGTSWEAEGEPMDSRTVVALENAGYQQPFEHTASAIHLSALANWDLVVAMTAEQAQRLRRMVDQMPTDSPRPEVTLWRRFDPLTPADAPETEIPVEDPWYEGQQAFDRTIVEMRRSLPALLEHLSERIGD
ncbi:MAG TPA: protein tyrosine phosphatase [Candidatus Brachybacterium merdigallinarum]|nr:protein tyrosine phosphatase [Candidatus Brachybacterium merdigallinarum]